MTNVSCNAGNFAYSYKSSSDLLETSIYLGGTVTVSRAYDILNRLTSISATSAVSAINSFAYTLDSTGRRTQRTDADGSSISWGYDSYNQLTSASKTNSANGAADAAYNYGYQYDQVGNRLHEDRGQQDLDGTFNPLNQITHLEFTGKLDIHGSTDSTNAVILVQGITNAPPFYNQTNWLGGATVNAGSNSIPIVGWVDTNATETNITVYLPPANPQEFAWDPNGSLISDGYRTYEWNEENRLKQIETNTNYPGLTRKKSEFVYDGMGRRVQRTDFNSWNGTNYTATNITRYIWDDWNLLAELTSGNSISNYYVWGQDLSQSLQGAGGIGGLLCMVDPSLNVYLYTFDGNGNVKDVLDETGASVASYSYDPFGRIVEQSGSFLTNNRWRFSSKMFDEDWGLYYYGFRYYSPDRARWLSRDLIGEREGANLYRFVRNRPIVSWDYYKNVG